MLNMHKYLSSDKVLRKGEKIHFSWEGDLTASGKWKKDGRVLESDGRIKIEGSREPWRRNFLSLTIERAKESDEGTYTLEVTRNAEKISRSATVKLMGM